MSEINLLKLLDDIRKGVHKKCYVSLSVDDDDTRFLKIRAVSWVRNIAVQHEVVLHREDFTRARFDICSHVADVIIRNMNEAVKQEMRKQGELNRGKIFRSGHY